MKSTYYLTRSSQSDFYTLHLKCIALMLILLRFFVLQKILYGANVVIFEGIMSFVKPEMREVGNGYYCHCYMYCIMIIIEMKRFFNVICLILILKIRV